MRRSLGRIAASWIKAKGNEANWQDHATIFFDGALATAKACGNEPLAADILDLIQTGPDLNILIAIGREWLNLE